MILKKDMEDGKYYKGFCRNAKIALWDEKIQKFRHFRYKFGYFMETIEHFEDVKEQRLDGFVPMEKIEPIHHEEVWKEKEKIGY